MTTTTDVIAASRLRNIALIAHVDHGKTTMVDRMLQSTGTFRAGAQVQERVMDSNPLERERGITIFAKNASVHWESNSGRRFKINLVDTPGHADFGGEVERILRMVDGALLLVDACEGPMPQTRFVTRKALELGIQPVVVINKVDRPEAQPEGVHDAVLELFMELEASDRQLDAAFVYASAKQGWASRDPRRSGDDLTPLFEAIERTVPAPSGDPDAPFQLLISTLDYSPYLGRLAIGRIEQGRVAGGDTVAVWPLDSDTPIARVRVPRLYAYEGLERREVESASAGEIVAVAGIDDAEIGATLCDSESPARLTGIAVEPPTLSVEFRPNDSPLAGRSGRFLTSRQIGERLHREALGNVALRVEETEDPDRFRVSGRGELHLSILMEQMRREGYEFSVSRPRVITRTTADGRQEEPFEELVVDVPQEMTGAVIGKVAERKGRLTDMSGANGRLARLRFEVPARGLTGYRSEFLTDTRGEGTLHRQFSHYEAWAGPLIHRRTGALVSMAAGPATAYSLFNLQERGQFFVRPGDTVYDGMIVGEHARDGDLEVNLTRGKKLSNVRAAGADENILLEPAREISLEFALEFIADDELVEVTPDAIRLRKRALVAHQRKRERRRASEA